MNFYYVDVFSSKIFAGNGLTVVFYENELESSYMLNLAQEFKQFETIFVKKIDDYRYRCCIFTVEEEIDFAGHPIIGAAGVIHKKYFDEVENIQIQILLNKKEVLVNSSVQDEFYRVTMNQGKAQVVNVISENDAGTIIEALNLEMDDLAKDFPIEVVSTGLNYLLIPLKKNIDKAKIIVSNFEAMLSKVNAKFIYVFDTDSLEARSWDNNGFIEDIATGSAAGPLGAYLYDLKIFNKNEFITIKQGRFVNRPSEIKVVINEKEEVLVSGNVAIMAKGDILN